MRMKRALIVPPDLAWHANKVFAIAVAQNNPYCLKSFCLRFNKLNIRAIHSFTSGVKNFWGGARSRWPRLKKRENPTLCP